MREMKLRLQFLQAARRLSRAGAWSLAIGQRGVIIMWGSLKERRATKQVMLRVSLRARCIHNPAKTEFRNSY